MATLFNLPPADDRIHATEGTIRDLTNRQKLAVLGVSHEEAIEGMTTFISRDFQKKYRNLNKAIRKARRAK